MDMTSNHISTYLSQIHSFLISNEQIQVFSDLTVSAENLLVNIAKDTSFLKHGMFDDDCKSVAAQITAVLEKKKQIYTLSYEFEKDGSYKKVIVYKKTPVPAFKEPLGLKQLRKPNSICRVKMSSDTTVMSSFKASSLNATLKFVKDDSRLVLKYPHMSTEQAQFITQMITQCSTNEGIVSVPGSKGLFDPLTEAIKIFSLKYQFKLIEAAPDIIDMKRLILEKIPKTKDQIEIDLNSSSSSDTDAKLHQITPRIENVSVAYWNATFLKIKHFITDDNLCLKFENVTTKEEQFLLQWKCYLKPNVRNWFFEEQQQILLDIEKLLEMAKESFKLKTIMEKTGTRRDVYVIKKSTKTIVTVEKPVQNTSIEKVKSDTSLRIVSLLKPIENKENTQQHNRNTSLNKPIEKVIDNIQIAIKNMDTATENMKVNKMESNSTTKVKISTEKVMTENPNKTHCNININTITKVNENDVKSSTSILVMTTDSEVTGKKVNVNTNNHGMNECFEINNKSTTSLEMRMRQSKLVNSEDFIAVRNTIVPKPSKKKLNTLIDAINKLNGKFARSSLTNLKEFITNPDKDTITFDNLKWEELEFLLRWTDVIKRVEIVKLFSINGQMLLDELRSLIDRCSGKFHVVVDGKTVSPINRTITFKKQYSKNKESYTVLNAPINMENKKTKTYSNDAENKLSDVISISSASSGQSEFYDKNIDHFIRTVSKIQNPWIKATLNQLLDFLKDDTQGSLIISNVTKAQNTFLLEWGSKLRNTEVRSFFPDYIRKILAEIYFTVFKNEQKYTISCKTTSHVKQIKDFMFYKEPVNTNPIQKAEKTQILDSKKSPTKINIIPTTSRRLQDIDKLANNESTVDKNKDGITATINHQKSNVQDTSRSLKSSSVTSLKAREEKVTPKSANNAKAKMIEALNQPLVSERGLKMMQNMGWKGGALGARGDGIVEPIALNLDGVKRAGLGCPKPTPKPAPKLKPTKTPILTTAPPNIQQITIPLDSNDSIKTTIIKTIKDMVLCGKGEILATEFIYKIQFSRKLWKFVKHTVNILNGEIPLNGCELDSVVSLKEVLAETEYFITACLGTSEKNLQIVLSKSIYIPSDSKSWVSVISADSNYNYVGKVEKPLEKMSNEPFRVYVMKEILEFCKETTDKMSPKEQYNIIKEIQLPTTMTAKQMSYVKDTIFRLNNKSKSSANSVQNVFEEILYNIIGFHLNVDFPTRSSTNVKVPAFKCIRLYKIFDANTTSIPKSNTEPVKNTVKSDLNMIKNITKNDISQDNNNNTKDVKTNRRTTFTNDTIDDKYMFDNPKFANQNKSIDNLYLSVNSELATDSKTFLNHENVGQDIHVKEITSANIIIDNQNKHTDIHNQNIAINTVPINNRKIDVTNNLHKISEIIDIDNQKPIDMEVPIHRHNIPANSTSIDKQKAIDSQNKPIVNKHDVFDNYDIKTMNNADNDEKQNGEKSQENTEDCKEFRFNPQMPKHADKLNSKSVLKIKITPKDYPQNKITNEMAGEIQKSILNSIDYTEELPLLECHGIQNGALFYTCNTQNSYKLIESVTLPLNLQLSITEETEKNGHKMTLKINSYIDEGIDSIFDRLETYNIYLFTKDWKVLKTEKTLNCIVIYLDIDEESYKLIVKENFALYAGTDQAKFSVIWD